MTTAIATDHTSDQLRELVEQQAALRRVATLVARGVDPTEVFQAVAEEMADYVHVTNSAVFRYEADGTAVVIASRFDPRVHERSPVGERYSLEGDNVAGRVLATARTTRMNTYDTGSYAARVRERGLRCIVGAPIVVDGRVWGMAAVASSTAEPLPAGTEVRVSDFADLVATAIANAAAREELIASRARIIAAADDARRRLERDLHDGVQQRLVSLGLQLREAQTSVRPDQHELHEQLSSIVSRLAMVSSELQQVSRGIHPAILAEGGLGPALKTLVRRSMVPVNFDVTVEQRFPDAVEVAAYYVVSEALTNAAKYAQAASVTVRAESNEAHLYLSVQDDGIGGADCRKGSGLIGLKDRVEAVGGRMLIKSPPGGGTTLQISFPLHGPGVRDPDERPFIQSPSKAVSAALAGGRRQHQGGYTPNTLVP